MTNVIRFPSRALVVISSGEVSCTRTEGERGGESTIFDPPRLTYFVDLVDDGGAACVWDGDSHEGALAAAEECARDGLPVRDLTDEARGRA